ncbi:MAG: UDP-glucose 4-epimerase [Firmicutes bacterium ADurb.Bin193]|nr:MAG: UDP-glucose 4-epimerase [Firmicutes bacterium ADurb.Bin193]
MKVLVTGGTGYIGSHTCIELLERGYELVVFDSLVNSSEKVVDIVKSITGKDFKFYKCDMLDADGLEQIFEDNKFDSVVHFAGLKAVGESVEMPVKYYTNNICGTLNLLRLMEKYEVRNIVFSSSATVYGDVKTVPISEDFPLSATNPYGGTKLMIENILKDLFVSDNRFSVSILRYFNPIGAHISGRLGENPRGIPNNLMPYITQVAIGKLDYLRVFGDTYPTRDGTGVRDYIHVVDLAIGHIKALEKKTGIPGVHIYNLGTGIGYSVLEILHTMEEVCKKKIPYRIVSPRAGDIAQCYADASKALLELGWKAERGLKQMCEDSWRWQSMNPNGLE